MSILCMTLAGASFPSIGLSNGTPVSSGNLVFNSTLVATPDLCPGGFLAVSADNYVSLSSLGTLFQTYFDFDATTFDLILTANLVTFVIGHGVGRMMNVWRKSF